MRKFFAAVAVVVLLAGPVLASAIPCESGAGFGAGVLVGLVGFTAASYGGFLNWGWGTGSGFETAGFAIMGLAPAACATGVSLVGRHYQQRGSLLASLGGSYVGAGVGVGLFALAMHEHSTGGVRNLHYVAAALTPFLMTAGGVVGYNLARRSDTQGLFESRLQPPALGVRPAEGGNLAADLRLVSVRF